MRGRLSDFKSLPLNDDFVLFEPTRALSRALEEQPRSRLTVQSAKRPISSHDSEQAARASLLCRETGGEQASGRASERASETVGAPANKPDARRRPPWSCKVATVAPTLKQKTYTRTGICLRGPIHQIFDLYNVVLRASWLAFPIDTRLAWPRACDLTCAPFGVVRVASVVAVEVVREREVTIDRFKEGCGSTNGHQFALAARQC